MRVGSIELLTPKDPVGSQVRTGQSGQFVTSVSRSYRQQHDLRQERLSGHGEAYAALLSLSHAPSNAGSFGFSRTTTASAIIPMLNHVQVNC